MRCWIRQCYNVQTYGRWTRYSNAECVAAKEEEVVDNICAILTGRLRLPVSIEYILSSV